MSNNMSRPSRAEVIFAKEIMNLLKTLGIAVLMAILVYPILYVALTPDYYTPEEIAEAEAFQNEENMKRAQRAEYPTTITSGYRPKESEYFRGHSFTLGVDGYSRNKQAKSAFLSDIFDKAFNTGVFVFIGLIVFHYSAKGYKWVNETSKYDTSKTL
jgi:hypothetical protein